MSLPLAMNCDRLQHRGDTGVGRRRVSRLRRFVDPVLPQPSRQARCEPSNALPSCVVRDLRHAVKKSMVEVQMLPHKTVDTKMHDAAAIRGVLPRHTVKRLADLLGTPLGTAHEWLYRNLSACRRREVALALIAELDEQDRQRAALRSHLESMVGHGEMDRAGGGVAADEAGRTEDGAPAGDVGQ